MLHVSYGPKNMFNTFSSFSSQLLGDTAGAGSKVIYSEQQALPERNLHRQSQKELQSEGDLCGRALESP